MDAASKDRKSTRLNSSHANISYAVFCLKKKNSTTRKPRHPREPPAYLAPHAPSPRRAVMLPRGPFLRNYIASTPFGPYIFFFFNDTATTEIYTLSLHDALPI